MIAVTDEAQPQFEAWIACLHGSGTRTAVLGQAGLALALGQPLPPAGTLEIAVAGTPPADLPPRVSAVALPTGEDFSPALVDRLRQAPIRAWAVALEPDGTLHDPLEGLADAREGRLRTTADVRAWLRADFAHVLELAVWAAQSGLRPTAEAVRIAQRDAGNVLQVDRGAWRDHFGAVLLGQHARVGLEFLHEARVLQLMVPEVVAMVDFHKSCPVHHKDIWDHTLQVVEKCPFSLTVRWAALMHDVGKVWTRSVNKQGKVHFFRHEEMGASLMIGVAARFELEPALRDRVAYVIGNHARANVYATEWTDSAVRRLIRDMGPHLDDVLAFSRSDFTTKRQWRIAEVRALAEELHQRIVRIAADDARVPPLPKGLGHVLMTATGLPPGPWLKAVTAWLEAEVEAGAVAAQQEAEVYLAHVRQHRADLLQPAEALLRGRA